MFFKKVINIRFHLEIVDLFSNSSINSNFYCIDQANSFGNTYFKNTKGLK